MTNVSDAQFAAWLRTNDPERTVLADMEYRGNYEAPAITPYTGLVRLATNHYVDDSGPHQYIDCIASVPSFSQAVDRERLGGIATLSFGTMELINDDGRADFLLNLAVDGGLIAYWLGSLRWARDDFRLMYSAIVQKVEASAPATLSVTLKDLGLLLDKSIGGSSLIGGTGPNADQPRSYFFGYVHQAECKVKDFGSLLYDYADSGSIADTVDHVRDQGVIVLYTDNTDGTVTLSASPTTSGPITADLYREVTDALPGARCSQLIDELIADIAGLSARGLYRGAHPSFTVGDADDYPVGILVADKTNLLDVHENAMTTALAFGSMNRYGQYEYGRLRPDDIASLHLPVSATVRADDIAPHDQIVIDRAVPTYYSTPVIVNRNWTSQSQFADSIVGDVLAGFTRTGYYVDPYTAPADDTYEVNPQAYHRLLVKAPAQDTLISAIDDATARPFALRWIAARLAQSLPWLEFVSVTVGLWFYYLRLGDVVRLDLDGRLGFDSNSRLQLAGMVMSVAENKLVLILVRRRPAIVTGNPNA
jgi:hypothetical protein